MFVSTWPEGHSFQKELAAFMIDCQDKLTKDNPQYGYDKLTIDDPQY